MFFKQISFLLGIAAIAVASNPMSVRAEAPLDQPELASTTAPEAAQVTPVATANPVAINSTPTNDTTTYTATPGAVIDQLGNTPATQAINQLGNTTPTPKAIAENPIGQPSVEAKADTEALAPSPRPQSDATEGSPQTKHLAAQPEPEKLETSANYLTAEPSPLSTVPANEANQAVAQNVDITPGRSTRGGSSYIGIGGNLGLTGSPALGDSAFVINSKIGLTRNISFRPAVLFGDDTDFLLPLTYDFVLESADPFAPIPFAPFLGGGVIVSTNGDNTLGFLLTGGVDVPLSAQFVANASINVGFRDDTDVGLILGVGYTFPGFSR